MAVANDYVTGTITLTNGSATFTGTGTAWRLAGFRDGDRIYVDNLVAIIAPNSVSDPLIDSNTSGKLTRPWTGTTGTRAYRMSYKPDGARVTAETRNLIELLGNGNLEAIAALTPTANAIIKGNTAGTAWEKLAATAFGLSILDDANGPAVYATLGTIPDAQLPQRITASGVLITDANSFINESGWGRHASTATNTPFGGVGYILNLWFGVANYNTQLWFARDSARTAIRNQVNGVFGSWVETTVDASNIGRLVAAVGVNDVGAYIFGQNTQSAAVGSGATISGANLRFAGFNSAGTLVTNASTQAGSWMSCSASKADGTFNTGVYKRIL